VRGYKSIENHQPPHPDPLPASGEREKQGRTRKRKEKSKIQVEIIIRSARWRKHSTAKTLARKAISAAAKAVSTSPIELAIVLGNDSAIRTLNRDWRGKDAPTNVLSFPAAEPPTGRRRTGGKRRNLSPYVGDIVIAYETVAREAKAQDKPFGHHLAHLAVHGFLHLHGYDHENDREAQKMERLERKILAGLAIPDPYAST
jgi:probable rRNA maturation factor